MAANWNNPTLPSLYTDVLADLKARDVDVLTMLPGTNLPVGAKRWNAPTNTFQSWDGAVWNNLIIAAAGGGTGSGAFPTLGTMASQNANAVAITGGTITGVALNAGDVTAGILALNRGGTGASLALGANGSFLQSNGAQVVFGVNGAALTGLNAGAITVGNLPVAQMPVSGTWNLTAAFAISSPSYFQIAGGSRLIVGPIADMGAGSINAQSIFINGTPLATGAGIPSGMLAMFELGCPGGWSAVPTSNGRLLRFGGLANGNLGGNINHTHGIQVNAVVTPSGSGATMDGRIGTGSNRSYDAGGSFSGFQFNDGFPHSHIINSDHQHSLNFSGTSDPGGDFPPFIEYFLCRKD